MNTTHLSTENSFYEFRLSRDQILDRFILASFSLGLIAVAATFYRDYHGGISTTNGWINVLVILGILGLWIARRRLPFMLKAMVLLCIYVGVSIKALLLFGGYTSAPLLFLVLCFLLIAVLVDLKWSMLIALLLTLLVPLRAFLLYTGAVGVEPEVALLPAGRPYWWHLYASVLMAAGVITIGVGELRRELVRYISLLHSSIVELETTNHKLTGEIELKNAFEESLIISSRKFESLFEGSRDGVILLNDKGKVLEANHAFSDLLGYSLQELRAGDTIFDVIDSPFKRAVRERFDKEVRGELMPGLAEATLARKNGELVPVEINSNLILTDEGVMVISTIRDASFRKQLENEKFNASLQAEERERERFSKDLHDDLGPVFSTVKLYLQTLSKSEADGSRKEVLDKLSGMVDAAVKQVRELSHNLSPYLLRDAGLVQAMAIHLAKIRDNQALRINFHHHLEPGVHLSHNVEVVLYRIFLELINNTVKHSGASEVSIDVAGKAGEITMVYADNGKGFDIHDASGRGEGIGLKNIENRVLALGGTITFDNRQQQMTTSIGIPL